MKQRVGAIIIDDEDMVLMKRTKKDTLVYWCFPGGEVEKDESLEEALVRECKEELGIEVKVLRLIAEEEFDGHEKPQMEYFYLCKKVGGILGTGDGPEYGEHNEYYGIHEPEKVKLTEVENMNVLPEKIKKLVVENFVK